MAVSGLCFDLIDHDYRPRAYYPVVPARSTRWRCSGCSAASIEELKQWHPAIKTGKGSLNFRLTDKLPEADIWDTIRRALDET